MPRRGQCISLKERLYRRFVVDPSGCWLCAGKMDKDGYPIIVHYDGNGRRYIRAARASIEVHKGPIPRGMEACHTCDVHRCVNPDHLYAGTRQQNLTDRTERKREPRGEECSWSKLSTEQVRHLRSHGIHVPTEAALLGISRSQAYRVRAGENWRDA